jgi:hypothetical protein
VHSADREAVVRFVFRYFPRQFDFMTRQLDAFRGQTLQLGIGSFLTLLWASLGAWLAILAAIEMILLATHSETPMEDFFRYFYVFADAVVGLAALYLVLAFRGRALAIPWLTISSFVVTDILYIRLTATGVYDYVMSGVSIALLADTLYVAAYLIVGWGVLEQFLLLQSSANQTQAGD